VVRASTNGAEFELCSVLIKRFAVIVRF